MLRRSGGSHQGSFGFDETMRLEKGQQIVFDFWPVPPSSNALYDHFIDPKTKHLRRPVVRRVCAPVLTKYKKECETWAMGNQALVKDANLYLRDETYIKVTAYVVLHEEKIYTKDGKLRKSDVSNRGKALFDCLSDAIGTDDKHFIDVRLVKTLTPPRTPEKCVIVLEVSEMRELHMKS